jgi:hypothetical protein
MAQSFKKHLVKQSKTLATEKLELALLKQSEMNPCDLNATAKASEELAMAAIMLFAVETVWADLVKGEEEEKEANNYKTASMYASAFTTDAYDAACDAAAATIAAAREKDAAEKAASQLTKNERAKIAYAEAMANLQKAAAALQEDADQKEMIT